MNTKLTPKQSATAITITGLLLVLLQQLKYPLGYTENPASGSILGGILLLALGMTASMIGAMLLLTEYEETRHDEN